jgi:hypothetical protein
VLRRTAQEERPSTAHTAADEVSKITPLAPAMLSLKDIYRHFGRRRTQDVMVRISHQEELSNDSSQIVEDLIYIGYAERRDGGTIELTEIGSSALAEFQAEVGRVLVEV